MPAELLLSDELNADDPSFDQAVVPLSLVSILSEGPIRVIADNGALIFESQKNPDFNVFTVPGEQITVSRLGVENVPFKIYGES